MNIFITSPILNKNYIFGLILKIKIIKIDLLSHKGVPAQ